MPRFRLWHGVDNCSFWRPCCAVIFYYFIFYILFNIYFIFFYIWSLYWHRLHLHPLWGGKMLLHCPSSPAGCRVGSSFVLAGCGDHSTGMLMVRLAGSLFPPLSSTCRQPSWWGETIRRQRRLQTGKWGWRCWRQWEVRGAQLSWTFAVHQ